MYRPDNDEIKAMRRQQYLKKWPVEDQLEAYAENAMGRPGKLNKMLEDFTEIRRGLPFSEGV